LGESGRPIPKTRSIGGFEPWSRTVGGVLEIANIPDFLSNLVSLYSHADEEAQEWEAFLLELNESYRCKSFTTSQLGERLETDPKLADLLPEDLSEAREKPAKNGNFAKKLGTAFRKRKGRRFGQSGVWVAEAGEAGNAKKWRVHGPPVAPAAFRAA
jgi:hypothetical protein